jgi:hypothetical protein
MSLTYRALVKPVRRPAHFQRVMRKHLSALI